MFCLICLLNVHCNTTYQERQRDWPYEALATFMKIMVLNPAFRFIGKKDELEREFYSDEIGSSSDLSEELFLFKALRSFLVSGIKK